MAYAEIYYFSLTSLKQSRQYTVSIEKEGFAGYAKEITIFPGRSPVRLEYDRDETIYKPVRSSTLTVTISTSQSGLTTQELIDFVSAEERQYRLTLTETVGTGTNTLWVGWLQPMEQLTLDLYGLGELDLVFVDGLVHLRNLIMPYDIDQSFEYDKLKETIRQCLLRTGHTFDVQLISSIRDGSSDVPVWDHYSLIKAAYLRSDSGGYLDAFTVLKLVLSKIGCTVYQRDGQWYVQNFMEGQADEARGALMASDGTGGGTLSWYSRNIDHLIDNNRFFLARNAQARLVNPVTTVSVKSDYLSNRMGVINWNFNTWSGAATDFPDNWTAVNSLEVLRQSIGKSSQYSVYLRGYYKVLDGGAPDRSMEYNGTDVQEGDKIIVGWEWEYLTFIGADTPIGRVSFFFDADAGGSSDRYLDENGEWQIAFTTIDGQKAQDVAVGNKVVTVPGQGRIIVNAHNPEATTAVGEDQTVYYVRLWYLGFIHVKEGERDENPISFSRFPTLITRTRLLNSFSNANIEPIEVIGYEGKNGEEMPESTLQDEVVQGFLGAERDGNDENQLVTTNINSDFLPSLISSMNIQVGWQILQFIRSNRFTIQADTIGAALQIGESYTYEIFAGEERTFICIGYVHDLKNDICETALLVECNMATLNNTITEKIFE